MLMAGSVGIKGAGIFTRMEEFGIGCRVEKIWKLPSQPVG